MIFKIIFGSSDTKDATDISMLFNVLRCKYQKEILSQILIFILNPNVFSVQQTQSTQISVQTPQLTSGHHND